MLLSIVAAMAQNFVIGKDDKIPWKIPGEQRRFRNLTLGKTVIMGRKTYESIGKPLPDRKNIVISRTLEYNSKNCITFRTLEDALETVKDEEEVFIAGGGEIYKAVLQNVGKMYLTIIKKNYEGNIYFPKFCNEDYKITYMEDICGEIPYTYYTYEKV